MLKIAIISNELPPYRVPYFHAVSKMPGVELKVFFCSKKEPNLSWNIESVPFDHVFLRERIITVHKRFIHSNPGVLPALSKFAPNVIVTGGFNPTHLFAFAYALVRNIPHVPMTDGTVVSEHGLSRIHRMVRQRVYAKSKAFVYASKGGLRLFQQYGIVGRMCFQSALCIDNGHFAPSRLTPDRPYDFLFCGRLEAVKNPLFAFEVALATARRLGRQVSILFVGSGELESTLRAVTAEHARYVKATFQGFTRHEELPALYQSAKIFLFPSRWDPWGVVANEACAAALPVLVSPYPGVAKELVIDGENGYVLPLDVADWVEHAANLLTSPTLWTLQAKASMELVSRYNYHNAAEGLVQACRFADERRHYERTLYRKTPS